MSEKRLRFEHLEARHVLDSVVVFNEIMHHPLGDLDDTREWIELYNQLRVNTDISDWVLDGGVNFRFANNTVVNGRGTLLVVPFDPVAEPQVLAEFKTAYNIGASVKIVGPYSGRLDNSGEELRLLNNGGRLMNTLDYGDEGNWPAGADGSGATLVKRDPQTASEEAANWTASTAIGGTPGVAAPSVIAPNVVINEISSASEAEFWLELCNTGTTAASIGGMVVRATGAAGGEYVLPALVLQPGQFRTLTEAELGFRAASGENVFLYKSGKTQLLDAHEVTNRLRGRSDRYGERWLWPTQPTPGAANAFTFQDNVVINEIMYHAYPILATATTPFLESDEEWIELYNRGATTVDLSGWQLRGGIDFTFPDGVTLGANSYLVVAKNAAALRAKYPAIMIVGDFTGFLNNETDTIRLVDANTNPADEVTYFQDGRWPGYADGGGSTLELRNPGLDNTKPEAWAASDESSKSGWKTFTITKTSAEPLEVYTVYNEFILGLLNDGEFLIDDISVVRDPTTSPVEMMQNGTFQNDTVGAAPAKWRLLGNHSGVVELDPLNAVNKVLHVTASDAQQFINDHVETTFVNNTAILDGRSYRISFRAKWVAGNSQLHNRLYFTRMGNVAVLDVPRNNGTPGAQNSRYVVNQGPLYSDFGHTPVLPQSGQVVTVYAKAADPDNVAAMTLRWRVESGALNTATMTLGTDGYYRATIAGQSSRTVVQFWVEGRDGLGATAAYPPAGANSRALYQVNDGFAPSTPVDSFRIILLAADNNSLVTPTNMMSTRDMPGTLIYNGQKAYYDVGVQLVGSRFIRPNSGYKVVFNTDRKFLGVHPSLRFDMSGNTNGAREIFMKQMVNRAGGSSVSQYDDIAYMISRQHDGRIALLQLARYEDEFLDSQFDGGGDGTLFEMDDISFPTNPSPAPEGLKTGTEVSSQDIRNRGTDKEAYRGQVLIKNNRAKDDYSGIVAMVQAMHKNNTAELYAATNAVMDVDLWMRHYATQAFLGNWDTYGFGRPKNLRIYQRPSDGKIIPLYWDADLSDFTQPLIYNGDLTRLDEIRNIPQNLRLFYGHLLDLTNRSFNDEYIGPWITHYTTLAGAIFGDAVTLVANRETQVRSAVSAAVPMVAFAFTNNGGNDFSINATKVKLTGTGWVDVREVRLTGSTKALPIVWTGVNTWEVTLPLASGANAFSFQAFNHQGQAVGGDTITVTSTVAPTPLQQHLRITEINYHPAAPTAAEVAAGFTDKDEFEFLELTNTSSTVTLDLHGAKFTTGIAFDFNASSSIFSLAPGERILLVRNPAAFEARYGTGLPVAGSYRTPDGGGKLDNSGEQITLVDGNGLLLGDFIYDDSGAWPGRADGGGSTLELISGGGAYSDPGNWRSSIEYGGTPGRASAGPTVVVNEVLTHSDAPLADAIELYNSSADPIDIGGWWLSDSSADFFKFQIPANTTIAGHGYLVFYEGHWVDGVLTFAANEFGGGPKGFGLNGAHGDDAWLIQADAALNVLRFADHAEFGAAANGESSGRWQDEQGTWRWVPLRQRTLGEANDSAGNGPRIGPVIISEVMYAPRAPLSNGETLAGFTSLDQMEYVEIFNPTTAAVNLTNWRLEGAVNYAFAAGTSLPAGGKLLIVAFNPTNTTMYNAFRAAARYNFNTTVKLAGPYTGTLDDGGEHLRLLRPDEPPLDEPTYIPGLLEDEVQYIPAWGGNGDGKSLTRLTFDSWGLDPENWVPATTSAGAFRQVAGRYVFYNNSAFDGRNGVINSADDNAIAADKSPLLPGGVAGFENYTSYGRGINGIMVDFITPASTVTKADFTFRVGNNEQPDTWALLVASPITVTMRALTGTAITRATITFPENSILNQWLEVKVAASTRTGLPVGDVFYFGNAVGETGNHAVGEGANAEVDASDEAAVRENRGTTPAAMNNPYDLNRDRRVNALDELLARAAYEQGAEALVLLDLRPAAQASSQAAAAEVPALATTALAAEAVSLSAPALTEAARIEAASLPETTAAFTADPVSAPHQSVLKASAAEQAKQAITRAAHDAVLAAARGNAAAAFDRLAAWDWLWQAQEEHRRQLARKPAAVSCASPAVLAGLLR